MAVTLNLPGVEEVNTPAPLLSDTREWPFSAQRGLQPRPRPRGYAAVNVEDGECGAVAVRAHVLTEQVDRQQRGHAHSCSCRRR